MDMHFERFTECRQKVWRKIGVIFFAVHCATAAHGAQSPVVVSTEPANGQTGVSIALRQVTVHFSARMNTGAFSVATSNWGKASQIQWSSDAMSVSMSRENADFPLPSNATVTFTLNPPGAQGMKDIDGNVLETYTFSFTTEDAVVKIPANAAAGFSWPYYLFVPPAVESPPVLLVEPNNTGTTSDDFSVHDNAAKNLARARAAFAAKIGCPLLVPVFPRPSGNWHVYTHALDRDSLLTDIDGLERIDLQLIAMIDDARARIAARGIGVDRKVFINGFSASGSFANRFALLHPQRVKAAACGSPGGFPTLPAPRYDGVALPYPVGVADIQQVSGAAFNASDFRKTPMYIYIGDFDNNDAVPYSDGFDPEHRDLIYDLFGAPPDYPFVRWPKAESVYRSAGGAARFHIYHGVGHNIVSDMWTDLENFFEHFRVSGYSEAPPPPINPHEFKLYFPHVACGGADSWETEIGVVSNHDGKTIEGEIRVYDDSGVLAPVTVPVDLPPLGRLQVDFCSEFSEYPQAAYLIFSSNSGFAAGYTRFSRPGNRVGLHASTGSRSGVFAKLDNEGATGVAFINTESETARVKLSAVDDEGFEIARAELEVGPVAKVVGTAAKIFSGDIGAATFIRYFSNKTIVGYELNISPDGEMLDGLPGIDRYIDE